MGRLKKTTVLEGEEGVAEATPGSSSSVTDIISHLAKTSDAHITRMTDNDSVITLPKFLSTGLPTIDYMLGGGVPAGRITELFSKGEGMGKSSLAAMLMCEMQRKGGTVLLMDTEHGFTTERLKTFGVDPDAVIYVEPPHIEGACQIIADTIKYLKQQGEKQDKMLIVWDSVTGTPSKAESEADYGDIQVASSARALSTVIKKLKDDIARSECYVVMITQTRQTINAGPFAEKHQAAGGMAIKYYAGARLVLYRDAGAWLKDGPTRIGAKITMMAEKSRMAAPFQKAEATLFFKEGYDRWASLFDILLILDVISQNGGFYGMIGVDKSFRKTDFYDVFQGIEDKLPIAEKLKAARLTDEVINYFIPGV
jgi:recombination protein RecA